MLAQPDRMQHPIEPVAIGDDAILPRLGLGTWMLRGQPCKDAVEHALALGYRHVDTAQAYDNESEVGAAVARSVVPRDRVWITTTVAKEHLHPAHLRRTTEDSLRRLGTDYVDLLLVHEPSPDVPLEPMLRALQGLREDGKTRFIGVSHFSAELMRDAAILAPELLANQVELHPMRAQEAVRDAAARMGVTLVACSPLARGQVLSLRPVVEIGEALGCAPAQVILRWLVQLGVAVIPKAASAEHRRENLGIFELELSAAQMQTMSELDRASRFIEPIWVQ